MDWQMAFNVLFGVLAAVFGWLARTMFDAVRDLKDDLSNLREEIARDRVHRDDFKEAIREIKAGLERIYDKLDGKADKGGPA
jgi:chromosome segregation ATPase